MEQKELARLLREVRHYEKESMGTEPDGPKVAVLGSASIQYFVKLLRYLLHRDGLDCAIYEGEYDGINMDVFCPNSALYYFGPEYVILLPHENDIRETPPLLSTDEKINAYLSSEVAYFQNIWSTLHTIEGVKVLQSNFVIPPLKSLGNLEYQLSSSRCTFLRRLNETLVQKAPPYVTVVDTDSLSADIGKYNWFDYSAYFLNKAPVRLDFMPEYAMRFARQITALRGNTRKCLVLDLDNTLWGGVVGDDGWNGILLDPNDAVGEAYRFFQRYVLSLRERGVILAVCSKNDEEIAKEPFLKNENMFLHLDHIACFVANWEDKVGNLQRIAQELNIGMDSFVFFDDNPAERELVRRYLPEVHVVEVPEDPAYYALQLEKECPFEWLQITKEDLSRANSYRENQERGALLENFVDYDTYLAALEMTGAVKELDENTIGRFVQLINKSNQFNLRTIRYTEEDAAQMMREENTRCLYARLSDKFSEYGIISCVILKKEEHICFIDTWVMSCRVLKRGVEKMVFDAILRCAIQMGCDEIQAEYIKTKKNTMVENFCESLGFQLTEASKSCNTLIKRYRLTELKTAGNYYIREEVKNGNQ